MGCCGGAFVLGLGCPMLIVLFMYILLLIYVVYYTYKHRGVDLNEWRHTEMVNVENKFDEQIATLNQKIASLG